MSRSSTHSVRLATVVASITIGGIAIAGCAQTNAPEQSSTSGGSASGSSILVGTTDEVFSVDPAGSYDNGSYQLQIQIFPFLVSPPYGSPDVQPDLAQTAEFTGPKEYTVTLSPDSKWSDGSTITSSDIANSFNRQVTINDPNGASSLLWNLESIDTPDATTVVFNLKEENDQTFPQVLSSPAGLIVPEAVFPADSLADESAIVAAGVFGGEYVLSAFDKNNTASYTANPNYAGLYGTPKSENVQVKYYTDASNLKLDVQQGNIDVAYRSFTPTDVADLEKQDSVKVWKGPGGEIRYFIFNFNTQPFGAKTAEADPAKALAVRQSIADVIDREALSTQVYKGTYSPLYSHVASGMTGSIDSFMADYGDGKGGPDVEKAKKRLADAGIEGPVALSMQYSPDHYGPSSGDEYALIKSQLEASGLFTVDLQATEWSQYSKDRVADVYPLFQLGWFPDYSDADNYMTPFFLRDAEGKTGFIYNNYGSDKVDELIVAQGVEPDSAKRTALIEEIQGELAKDIPTLPLLQGEQVAVAGTDVTDLILDPSFKFHYGSIEKN